MPDSILRFFDEAGLHSRDPLPPHHVRKMHIQQSCIDELNQVLEFLFRVSWVCGQNIGIEKDVDGWHFGGSCTGIRSDLTATNTARHMFAPIAGIVPRVFSLENTIPPYSML